jgi:outer membrane murein-binding lipoprotein Lpp
LGELSNSITAITQLIEDLELRIWQSQELSFLDELELNFRKIFARALSNSKLDRSIDSLTMLISSAEQGETILASLSNLTHSDIQCSALQKIAAEQHRLNYQVNALSALIETVESKSQRSQTLDFEIDDYRMRFDQIMNEIGACPLCGAIQKKGGCEHVPNSGSR